MLPNRLDSDTRVLYKECSTILEKNLIVESVLSPSSQCFLGLRSLLPDCFPILTLLLLFGAGAQSAASALEPKPSGEVHARSEPRETRALVG